MRLSTTTSVLVLVVAAFALAACAPLRVNSFTDTRANLPGYRTYTWDPAGPGATGDPRLDNNRFFRERIVAAVDRELSAKGFERTAGPADVVIHLHARVDQKIAAATLDPQSPSCSTGDCRPQVFDEGTMLLDVIDAGTHRLVWRGWSESSFEGVILDQDWMDETIDRIVHKLFERFPRRAA